MSIDSVRYPKELTAASGDRYTSTINFGYVDGGAEYGLQGKVSMDAFYSPPEAGKTTPKPTTDNSRPGTVHHQAAFNIAPVDLVTGVKRIDFSGASPIVSNKGNLAADNTRELILLRITLTVKKPAGHSVRTYDNWKCCQSGSTYSTADLKPSSTCTTSNNKCRPHVWIAFQVCVGLCGFLGLYLVALRLTIG